MVRVLSSPEHLWKHGFTRSELDERRCPMRNERAPLTLYAERACSSFTTPLEWIVSLAESFDPAALRKHLLDACGVGGCGILVSLEGRKAKIELCPACLQRLRKLEGVDRIDTNCLSFRRLIRRIVERPLVPEQGVLSFLL